MYYYKDHMELDEKVKAYLHNTGNNNSAVRPIYFLGEDPFKDFANGLINVQIEVLVSTGWACSESRRK